MGRGREEERERKEKGRERGRKERRGGEGGREGRKQTQSSTNNSSTSYFNAFILSLEFRLLREAHIALLPRNVIIFLQCFT
jgi:hypothetical protein